MSEAKLPEPQKLSTVQWLIVSVAALGFAFDIYELLMMPLIARPALAELLQVDPNTDSGHNAILAWTGYIMYASAICGGTFGLLGGYLTDYFGRRRVLVWSILLYAFSAFAAGFATSPEMLLVLRCTTFIGVCVEFVAAVAWLAELFPNPKQRESVLGYTQAFSSVGGLLVTGAFILCNQFNEYFPAIYGEHTPWRYTLISGVIPALPLIVIRPFLPESPAWHEKRAKGLLKRPSFGELFAPAYMKTTILTAIMIACAYGTAFGAIQLTPQIVPGLDPELPKLVAVRKQYETAQKAYEAMQKAKMGEVHVGMGVVSTLQRFEARATQLRTAADELSKKQQTLVGQVQLWQELGGLLGRFVLAFLAVRILSRQRLLRVFLIPGLILIPLVYAFPAAGHLGDASVTVLMFGMFVAGFFTVAQFSFWGNYLPRMYPVHLRGTGESFAANVGGRMFGTAANPLNALLLAPLLLASVSGITRPASLAYAAVIVVVLMYGASLLLSFFLAEPRREVEEA
jgi:MFS family permease